MTLVLSNLLFSDLFSNPLSFSSRKFYSHFGISVFRTDEAIISVLPLTYFLCTVLMLSDVYTDLCMKSN